MIFLQNLMEAGSGIENTMADINGGLQAERYIGKNYTNQVNQALSRCFFSVFSLGQGDIKYFSTFHYACMQISAAAGFYEFHFKFKE